MPLVLGAAENAALFRLNLVQQQVWCKIMLHNDFISAESVLHEMQMYTILIADH